MAAMHESWLRASLVVSAGAALSWLLGWALDKPFPRSKMRDAILTGACIYAALMLDSLFLK
jgi:high-affinity Fe2+/Pb2+ permease